MRNTTLETIAGTLANVYTALVPGTLFHADQVMREKILNRSVREKCVDTADGFIYCIENFMPVLYICRESALAYEQRVVLNPILKNIDSASRDLETRGRYFVRNDDFEAIKKDSRTLRISLEELRNYYSGSEYSRGELLEYDIPTLRNRKMVGWNSRDVLLKRLFNIDDGEDEDDDLERFINIGIKKMSVRLYPIKKVFEHAERGSFAVMGSISYSEDNCEVDILTPPSNRAYTLCGARRTPEMSATINQYGLRVAEFIEKNPWLPQALLEELMRNPGRIEAYEKDMGLEID